jgi:ATP-dependent DNA helicase RecG
LLFGKNPQKNFLLAETRCARFKGTEPLEFIDMKVFGGVIIDQRGDALEFVKEHIKLHAKIVGTERVEKWEYPMAAIREAITNAICHRDYETKSNVQVRIFDDRIEVWGCGFLPEPLTVEDLKKAHRSILRNPLIGKCFFLIKFIEEWGTGTNRIIKECLDYGLPEPLFEEVSGGLVVTLRKEISEDFLRERGLNERQIKAVFSVVDKQAITNKEYQELFTISKRTATSDLADLVDHGIFRKMGRGKRDLKYVLR